MPLPVIDGVFRTTLNWHCGRVPSNAANVMHFKSSSLDQDSIMAALDSHVVGDMWGQTCTDASVISVDCTPLDGSGVSAVFFTGSPTKWSGNRTTGDDIIPQQASVVKFGTAKRGRSYRGRVYLPWVAEGIQANGLLVGPWVPLAQTAWDTFLSSMAASDAHLVVASYKLATADEVIQVHYEQDTATQRRRWKRTSV